MHVRRRQPDQLTHTFHFLPLYADGTYLFYLLERMKEIQELL